MQTRKIFASVAPTFRTLRSASPTRSVAFGLLSTAGISAALMALGLQGCSDAVAPPASIAMYWNFNGVAAFSGTVPENDTTGTVRQVAVAASAETLKNVFMLEDGDGGAEATCTVQETGAGAYTLNMDYASDSGLVKISVAAVTTGGASTAGYVSVRSPETAETYAGSKCTVSVGNAKEGGGAIVAQFQCPDSKETRLISTSDCRADATDCDKHLDGMLTIYMKNCKKK
ncbi:MAG TPA: hypothetical protein VHM70_14045 [Polyangiaceae bacterium]|nr:hypothetical protein [Polyangiaceae bacterium]